MKIKLQQSNGWDVISIQGSLVMAKLRHIPPIFTVLGEKPAARVALDLANTEAMDSGALSILVQLKKQVLQNGGQLALIAPSEEIQVLFGIVGFESHVSIYDSIPDFELSAQHQHN